MIVEALIKITESTSGLYESGDIITIQNENHPWGKGDLMGCIIISIDLNLPCGSDFMINQRCSNCDYQKIEWPTTSLSDGTIGSPRIDCDKEKYSQADVDFIFRLNNKGIPYVEPKLNKKSRAKIDLNNILNSNEIKSIASEKNHLSNPHIISRLNWGRDILNHVNKTDIIEKV